LFNLIPSRLFKNNNTSNTSNDCLENPKADMLLQNASQSQSSNDNNDVLMFIQNIYQVSGIGVVVMGYLNKGKIHTND